MIDIMYTLIYIYRCEFKYNAIYLNTFLCHKCTSKYTYIIHVYLKIIWVGAFSSVHHYYKYIFNNSGKNYVLMIRLVQARSIYSLWKGYEDIFMKKLIRKEV